MAETTLDKIKKMLDEYVKNGGNVDDLGRNDSIYQYIIGCKLKDENGQRLGVADKFALAGHPRSVKRVDNVEESLVKKAQAWLDAGNDFHVTRKSLPFFEELHNVVKARRKKEGNPDLAYETVMKDLGFKNYSDTYYRYSKLLQLENYQDREGYADNYRNDAVMKGYVNSCAVALDMPIAVVVGLIGDQNLHKYYLDVDYFKMLKEEIEEYISENGSLKGLKNTKLSNKFELFKDRIYNEDGSKLSSNEALALLDVDHEESRGNVKAKKADKSEFDAIMAKLKVKADTQNGDIRTKDIDKDDYLKILAKSVEYGCYMGALFKLYDMNYVDAKECGRFKHVVVEEYPYMSEMRRMRNEIYKRVVESNELLCKEEKFEAYMQACILAYENYKGNIHNFDVANSEDVDESKE